MKEFVTKYQKHITTAVIAVVVVVIIYLLYSWWKKKDETTIKVVDDKGNTVIVSEVQLNEASAMAKRLSDDLSSGWLFGVNFTGQLGRDVEAYLTFGQMSDTSFALTCQKYQELFGSSLVADIRAEDSIAYEDFTKTILAKADRLKIA